jgi:cysteine desulfurase/selenocysteine lyase
MRILKKIGLDNLEKDERDMTAQVLRGLSGINSQYGADTITVFGIDDPAKLGNKGPVVAFFVDGIPHNIVAMRLAQIRGIGVRDGCFCAQRLLKILFDARGKDVSALVRQGKAPGLVRVSIGLENTAEDIDEFFKTLTKIINDPDSKKFIPGEPDCRYCAGTPTVSHAISKQIDAFVQGVVRKVYDVDTERLIKQK